MLILVCSEDDDLKICKNCGDEIPDPYYFSERLIACSTCDGAQYLARREERLRKAHASIGTQPAPICDCGRTLKDCTPWNCPDAPAPPKPNKKRQLGLFE